MENANEIIEQAENLKRTQGRINLVEIANTLGIKVYTTKDIKQSSFIAFDPENECYEIYINGQEAGTRQRFSIAHEIAHYILHKDKIISFGVVGRQCEVSLTVEEEREADMLAAHIIMPPDSSKEYLNSRGVSIDLPITKEIITQYANEFGVSMMAAILRLRELGYYVRYIEL